MNVFVFCKTTVALSQPEWLPAAVQLQQQQQQQQQWRNCGLFGLSKGSFCIYVF
jgi:hypothetical protein